MKFQEASTSHKLVKITGIASAVASVWLLAKYGGEFMAGDVIRWEALILVLAVIYTFAMKFVDDALE